MEKIGPNENLLIPENVLHGPNLLWHVDAMFGGGGTMNREAASLGVPAFSFFSGPLGAVDRYLSEHGKLTMLHSVSQIEDIQPLQASASRIAPRDSRRVLNCIVENVLEVALS